MDWRPKTIRVLEENTRKKLCDKEVGFGNHFLYIIPKKKQQKKKINWNSTKFKNFVHQRIQPTEWKGNPWNEDKICANHVFDTGLISRIYKEFLQLHNNNLKLGKELEKTFL